MKQQQARPGIGYCIKSAVIGGGLGIGILLMMASVLAALELTAGIGESGIKMLMRLSLIGSSLAAVLTACIKTGGKKISAGILSIVMIGLFLLILGSVMGMETIPSLKGAWLPIILGAAAGMLLTGKGRGGHKQRSRRVFTG